MNSSMALPWERGALARAEEGGGVTLGCGGGLDSGVDCGGDGFFCARAERWDVVVKKRGWRREGVRN